jgi:hypothetical protein
MAGDLVPWRRGAREDELAILSPVVNGSADDVPDLWFALPLVDEPRNRAVEDQAGIDCRCSRSFNVDIEKDFASGKLSRGRGLAARFGALDHDCPHGIQGACDKLIGDPRVVGVHGRGLPG